MFSLVWREIKPFEMHRSYTVPLYSSVYSWLVRRVVEDAKLSEPEFLRNEKKKKKVNELSEKFRDIQGDTHLMQMDSAASDNICALTRRCRIGRNPTTIKSIRGILV